MITAQLICVVAYYTPCVYIKIFIPSKIEWDLPNGPLTKLLELLDTNV